MGTDTEGNLCERCVKGFYLIESEHICHQIFGCAKSDEGNREKCSECEIGFCKNKKTGKCEFTSIEQDPLVCYKCVETNEDGTKCEICMEGYELSPEGICQDYTKCEEKDSEGNCIKCRQNYFRDNWIKSYCVHSKYGCVENLEGCLICKEDSNSAKCDKCFDGYILDEGYQWCQKCQEGCATCLGTYDCGSCLKEGFYTIQEASSEESFDAICGKCVEGCKKCQNEQICEECFSGFYLSNEKSESGNLECVSCSEWCLECNDGNTCNKCDFGYELFPSEDKILCKKIEN